MRCAADLLTASSPVPLVVAGCAAACWESSQPPQSDVSGAASSAGATGWSSRYLPGAQALPSVAALGCDEHTPGAQ
jgi:hypothetical protein